MFFPSLMSPHCVAHVLAIAIFIQRIARLLAQTTDDVFRFWKPYSPNDGANHTKKIALKGTVSTTKQKKLVDNLSCSI